MNYKLRVDIAQEDLKEIALRGNTPYPIVTITISGLLAFLLVWIFFDDISFYHQFALFFVSIALFVPLVWHYFMWRIKTPFRENPEMVISYNVLVGEEGIKVEDEKGFVQIDWDNIRKIRRSTNFIYIRSSKNGGVTIPKKSFKDTHDFNEFHDFLEGKAGGRSCTKYKGK